MRTMLDRLPGLDPADPPSGECRRYFVESSERILLGPVSLAKFASRVSLAAAAFRLGGRGRVARFETPSGAITKIAFEYPSQAVAAERFPVFRALRGAGGLIHAFALPRQVDPAVGLLSLIRLEDQRR